MKQYTHVLGAFALMLAMSGLPAVAAHAEDGYGDGVSGAVRVNLGSNTQGGEANASTSVSVRAGEDGEESSGNRTAATSTTGRPSIGIVGEQELEMEDDATPPVSSLSELKQTIEARTLQLSQQASSTAAANQDMVQNTNLVRVAVRALVASQDLLGGIGPQVSQIAKEMNNSIATTTSAEAKIQSRGFFTRLLFGGDSAAADVISQEIVQNQQRIDTLTQLLNQANISADVQATLKAQITAVQDAQVGLQTLAQKEKGQWGLFSWRF